jgi:phage terminase large subunit
VKRNRNSLIRAILLILLMTNSGIIQAIQYYFDHPVEFVQDQIGANPEKEQQQMLKALVNHRYIAVKSGHGIGKSATEAWAILWFLFTHPHAKAPCTAPTGHQLDDILWPEVGKWLDKSNFKSAFEHTKTKLYMRGHEKTWFAVPRSCSVPENLQGFHGDHVLFVVDEASGVPKEIMEVIEGALTNEGSHLLMCGNPTQITGTFFDAFHRDRALYKTFTFNGELSKLVSPDYCERVALKFGRESDVYRVRVLGDFPRGNPDALIRLDEVEPAVNRKGVTDEGPIELGVDPARYGDDMSVICSRKGAKVFPFDEFGGINTTRLTGEVSKRVKELRKKFNYKETIRVKVDDTGIGAGVTDQLELIAGNEDINIEVCPINFGWEGNSDYAKYAGVMWGHIKDILSEISIPEDAELISQLTSRKYTLAIDGRIVLEKKEEMKRRKLPSPDKADAIALAFDDGKTRSWGLA